MWGREIEPRTVLYLSLEDTLNRLQDRLFRLVGSEDVRTRKRYTCHFNYCIPSFHDMDVGAGYYSEMGRFCYPTVDYRFNGLLLGPDHHILLLQILP